MEKIITVDDIHWETSKTLTFKLAARTDRQVCLKTAYTCKGTPEVFPNPPQTNHTPRLKKKKKKKTHPVFFSIHMLGEADAQVSVTHDITQPHTALWEILFHVDSQLNRKNEPSPLILKRQRRRKAKG